MKGSDEHIFNVFLFIAVFCFIAWLFTSNAKSHEWYPPECCSGQDCAEVTATEELGNGDLKVTSKHGTTVVPKAFPRRPSQDNKEHVCMRVYDKHLLCYFVPMGS